MAISTKIAAAKTNIKKAQDAWHNMTPRQRTLAQPQGRGRAKVGTKGEGQYYRIEVRPKREFTTFRYHDVGEPGLILRLAGKRSSGSWDDHAWLVDKEIAKLDGKRLVSDIDEVKEVLEMIGPVEHVKGDVFKGHPRENVPEASKPTLKQRKAQTANIKKAQAARFSQPKEAR
jgi:hypothetical protein